MKIAKITKKKYHGSVHNFGSLDDESYVVEGVKVKNCRGLWVPIFEFDEEKPSVTGIPKTVQDSFDTVDGRPTVNAFKQLRRPIPKSEKAIQESIRRKLG